MILANAGGAQNLSDRNVKDIDLSMQTSVQMQKKLLRQHTGPTPAERAKDNAKSNSSFRNIVKVQLILILLLFFYGKETELQAQIYSADQVKSGYIYKFIEYVNWANEAEIDTFVIGIYGKKTPLFDELSKIVVNRKIRNIPLTVKGFSNMESARQAHLLFLPQTENERVRFIASQLRRSNTLLITDGYTDRKSIMINLTYPQDDLITFEVNRPNIVFELLKVSKDILLLGGTELDVATLYREMEDNSQRLRETITRQQAELEKGHLDLLELIESSKTQDGLIRQKEIQLDLLRESQTELQILLEKNRSTLDSQKVILAKREKHVLALIDSVLRLTGKIALNREVLAMQKKEIQRQSKKNVQQGKTLRTSIETIQTQKTFMAVISALLLTVGFLSIFSYRNYKFKQSANLALEGKNNELEMVNKELSAFSYSVSHDLRAPLRGLDGFSDALMQDNADQLDKTGKDYLKRIRASAQRMGFLIDGLLSLSRLTRTQMKKSKVNISKIVEAVVKELEQSNTTRNVKFKIKENIMANCDPDLLKIALANLINNAWKFTANKTEAEIEFGVTNKNEYSEFFVRDNGAGFDMAYADKLFIEFQRLHSQNEFEGHGIGLATVRRIVHRHGGQIRAEAETGKGAIFFFTLG